MTDIRAVASRVTRHPLMADLQLETIVDYTADFIAAVGDGALFDEKTAVLDLEDNRALLPCDYVRMIQVRSVPSDGPSQSRIPFSTFRYSTDSFHYSPYEAQAQDAHRDLCFDLTYKIQGDVIYTSIKEGRIEIAYVAMAVDGEGLPMVSDDPRFLRALEAYIKKQKFTVLFDMNKINAQALANAQQDYAFCVAQLQEKLATPSFDKAQNITAMQHTLLRRYAEHSNSYANLGSTEHLHF